MRIGVAGTATQSCLTVSSPCEPGKKGSKRIASNCSQAVLSRASRKEPVRLRSNSPWVSRVNISSSIRAPELLSSTSRIRLGPGGTICLVLLPILGIIPPLRTFIKNLSQNHVESPFRCHPVPVLG